MTLGRSAGVTDTGRKRRRNEDSFVLEPPLFAVADGMGGAQAGEIASRLTAEILREGPRDGSGSERVAALIRAANRAVFDRSNEDPNASGMGTTVTAAFVEDGIVWIGHVGDSRAYLIREGTLEQLTEDHSLVGELVRSGRISREEAEGHPQRSVITRALGTERDVDVDTFAVESRAGDLFLLCSDGLTSMVGDEAILRILDRGRGDLDQAARRLVSAANQGGGEDNITVVVFEIADAGAAPAPDETARMPAAGAEPDDEDTLSGIDAIPPVATEPDGGGTRAESPQRAEPTLRRRHARLSRSVATVTIVVAVLLLVLLTLWGLTR